MNSFETNEEHGLTEQYKELISKPIMTGVNTKVALTLSNSIIGVSILAMPFCMKQCGVVLGVLMLSLGSLLTRFTCHLLLKSAHVSRRKTFEYVALHTFGPIGKLAVELNIIGFMLGILISFFVVIGDLGPAILSHAFGIQNNEMLRSLFLIFIGLCVALPFAMLRELESLAQISTLSILFYVILSLNSVVEALPVILSGSWMQRIHWWQPAGILKSLPIFALALSCQTQIFEIYDTLPDPSLKQMNSVVRLAVYICATLYFTVGFFGYVANYEHNFSGNILLSSSPGFLTEVIKLLFVLSVALSFPLVILPCRTSIHSLLFKRIGGPFEVGGHYISDARFKGITISIVITTLVIGILCPNIEMVLEFVGSTIGILICVIFPAVMFIQLTPKSTFEKWGAQFVLITGILLLASCTWMSFEPTTTTSTLSGKNQLVDSTNDIPVDPNDYVRELKVSRATSPIKIDQYNIKKKHKTRQTIASSLKSIAGSSVKPPPPQFAVEEKESHLKVDAVDEKPIDVKINEIKRQEPPEPQEPEESPNQELENNKEDGFNNELVNVDKRQEELDGKGLKVNNPGQTLIKQEELLKKMESQQEEQKKILEEQREILKELKAHGKSHDDSKEPHGNRDSVAVEKQPSVETMQQNINELSVPKKTSQDGVQFGSDETKKASLDSQGMNLTVVNRSSNLQNIESDLNVEKQTVGNISLQQYKDSDDIPVKLHDVLPRSKESFQSQLQISNIFQPQVNEAVIEQRSSLSIKTEDNVKVVLDDTLIKQVRSSPVIDVDGKLLKDHPKQEKHDSEGKPVGRDLKFST